jgi:hypothetical protein
MATRTISHIEFPADDGARAANGGPVITPPSDIPGQGR